MTRGRKSLRPDPGPGILGVVGDPVDHSLSPRFQNAALQDMGLPYIYRAITCPTRIALKRLIQLAPNIGLRGLNVTTPLKEAAAQILIVTGMADEEVRWSRSANTLVFGDQTHGASTDGKGGILHLRELGFTARSRILILGAGATARSLLWHLMMNGWRRVGVVTGKPRSIRSLLRRAPWPARHSVQLTASPRFGEGRRPWDVLISTWPPEAVTREFARELMETLAPGATVVDLNYGSGRDRLRHWASRAGFEARDGRGFLLHQGALSFRMWTGRKPPLDVMRRALRL
jgi:shikimate dehydrogenase